MSTFVATPATDISHAGASHVPGETLPAPPGPSAILMPGATHDPLQFLLDLTRDYGDLVRYQTPYSYTYIANSPETVFHVLRDANYPRGSLLKQVLGEGMLSSEGAHWKKHRSLMLPDFHPHVLATHAHEIRDSIADFVRRWLEYSRQGTTFNASDEMMNLTLDIVRRALFSGEMNEHMERINVVVKALLKDVGGFVRSEFGTMLEICPTRNRLFQESLKELNEIVYDVIARRRRELDAGRVRYDLLDMLMETRDQNGDPLEEVEVRDEVVTMLFAGNETTAVMLGWVLHCVKKYPGVEDKIHAELKTVLNGRAPELAELPQLDYLSLMLHETMRLYPPVWSIFRKVAQDDEINGYKIEAGHTMIVSPFTMHYHPKYWPDPTRFDPSRHTREKTKARPKYAYIPFGGGRHLCIGKHLAMMETKIIMATLCQCFTWEVAPSHVVDWEPLVTLRQQGGLPISLQTLPNAERVLQSLKTEAGH
jgi:cytochrome P450